MWKRFVCIILCYFSVTLCYSQKEDTFNGKGHAVAVYTNPRKDSLTKLNFILFDSVIVTMYGQTRLRINSLEQLGIYLDHSTIKFENTDVIIITTQMTDMKFYDPLKNFIQRYKVHSIISKSIILQDPGSAK